jgi:hypothetical protein
MRHSIRGSPYPAGRRAKDQRVDRTRHDQHDKQEPHVPEDGALAKEGISVAPVRHREKSSTHKISMARNPAVTGRSQSGPGNSTAPTTPIAARTIAGEPPAAAATQPMTTSDTSRYALVVEADGDRRPTPRSIEQVCQIACSATTSKTGSRRGHPRGSQSYGEVSVFSTSAISGEVCRRSSGPFSEGDG